MAVAVVAFDVITLPKRPCAQASTPVRWHRWHANSD